MVSKLDHVFDRWASTVLTNQQCASIVDGRGQVWPSHNGEGSSVAKSPGCC